MQDGGTNFVGGFTRRERAARLWQWFATAWVAVTVAMLVAGVYRVATGGASAMLVILLLLLLGLMPAWIYAMAFDDAATRTYISNTRKFYLCGRTLFECFDVEFFQRMAGYVGHGLCYEVAAVNMVAMNDFTNSQLVVGRRYMPEIKRRERHAWVEFRMFGAWWVIDPMLEGLIVVPRAWYNLVRNVHRERTLTHQEFWNLNLSNKIEECMTEELTSWVFHELAYYHGDKVDGKVKFGFEMIQRQKWSFSGEKIDPRMYELYRSGRPITQEVIERFLSDPDYIVVDIEDVEKLIGAKKAAELLGKKTAQN